MAKRLRGWVPRVLTVAAISVAAVSTTASTRVAVTLSAAAPPAPAPPGSLLDHPLALFSSLSADVGPFASLLAAQQGLLRSSRAIYTFALNTCDYKYSLRGYEDQSPEYYAARSEVHVRAAQRILQLCQANRGLYIKAGQFVGSLSNIPKEYASALSVLQDQARSRPFQAIERVLLSEFGRAVLNIFAEFDQEPIAAASLAQVHRAVLKDGGEVAVKVQYPQLQDQFQMDVNTMAFLSKAVTWLFPDYQFEWIVPEFEKNLSKELNFILEGKNAEQTARNFANNDHLRVPHIFWDYTTERVLTMEFMGGCKVDDVESLKKAGVDQQQVAEFLVEVFAEMVFCHGFVHGDPHPGNILVRPREQSRGKRNFDLVLLDHGLYRELDDRFRADYCRLWKALILLDPNEMEEVGDRLGAGKYYRYLPVIFTGRPIGSKGGLGEGMTSEEKDRLRSEVQHFTMGDISEFMEGLPRDFLTVLRTDGLLRSITHKLGAEPRMRLMANAKYAVMGLTLERRGGSGETQSWQALTKAIYDYVNLRIRLEVFELSYRFGLFYGSLLRQLRSFFRRTIGQLRKKNNVTVLV